MISKVLADIVVLTHFFWILFLFLGALWGVRSKTVRIIHLSGLAFAFLFQIFDWYCPLTHLEIWLRSKHDPALAYGGSFIVHYVEKVVYLELSGQVIFILTLLLIGFNSWLYVRRRK